MYHRLGNPQIASVIVFSKWDRMVYDTVLTAEKWGPQIAIAVHRLRGFNVATVKHLPEKNMFCSNDVDKSRGKAIFKIPRWPLDPPANQHSQSSPAG